jgi:hypothetical protein
MYELIVKKTVTRQLAISTIIATSESIFTLLDREVVDVGVRVGKVETGVCLEIGEETTVGILIEEAGTNSGREARPLRNTTKASRLETIVSTNAISSNVLRI